MTSSVDAMPLRKARLSKSKLMAFRQCPKKLWLEVHQPELKEEDASAQRRFQTGHAVGDLARLQYPDGVLIAPDNDLARAKTETKALIASRDRKVLFEATFEALGLLVRVDLLIPREGGWHMVEVKSSTKAKGYHLEDAAIQTWVARKCGLPLVATSLQVIDSKWTYPGGNHYSGLLRSEPIDDRIGPFLEKVPKWLDEASKVVASAMPTISMGNQCEEPYACSFFAHCSKGAPQAEMPLTWIPRINKKKVASLAAKGVVELRDLDLATLTDTQRRVATLYLGGKEVRRPLSTKDRMRLDGTRYYIDFESVQFGVPIWAGTRPYQQLCFQWSCDIEEQGDTIEHREFLDLTGDDPSRKFAESLIAILGKKGPVLVYNQSFEVARLRELAARFSDLAPALDAIVERVVDLLPITVEHYFHPGLEGSWSIKNVLRTIRPDRAHDLLEEIAEGGAASEGFLEAIDPTTTAVRKEQIHRQLLEYCGRDTEAMIHVLHRLTGD